MSGGPATPRTTLKAKLKASAVCKACGHIAELDLHMLVAKGKGDVGLPDLPLRCRCGARGHRIIVCGALLQGARY